MRRLGYIAALALMTIPATAADCLHDFKPVEAKGNIKGLTLYRFSEHWELQAATPSQLPLAITSVSIDGEKQKVFIGPGLDDLLFTISTDESTLDLSDAFLSGLARGSQIAINADTETARFSLKGSAAAIKRLKACKPD